MLKVLYLWATPKETSNFYPDKEIKLIKNNLAAARETGRLHFNISPLTWDSFYKELLIHKPNVLHISSHGAADGKLLFTSDYGNPLSVEPQEIGAILGKFASDLKCVILSACYSERQADYIRDNIDCVLAYKSEVDEKDTHLLIDAFYSTLNHQQYSIRDLPDIVDKVKGRLNYQKENNLVILDGFRHLTYKVDSSLPEKNPLQLIQQIRAAVKKLFLEPEVGEVGRVVSHLIQLQNVIKNPSSPERKGIRILINLLDRLSERSIERRSESDLEKINFLLDIKKQCRSKLEYLQFSNEFKYPVDEIFWELDKCINDYLTTISEQFLPQLSIVECKVAEARPRGEATDLYIRVIIKNQAGSIAAKGLKFKAYHQGVQLRTEPLGIAKERLEGGDIAQHLVTFTQKPLSNPIKPELLLRWDYVFLEERAGNLEYSLEPAPNAPDVHDIHFSPDQVLWSENMLFSRASVLYDILNHIGQTKKRESPVVILGYKKMGKTSALQILEQKLAENGNILLARVNHATDEIYSQNPVAAFLWEVLQSLKIKHLKKRSLWDEIFPKTKRDFSALEKPIVQFNDYLNSFLRLFEGDKIVFVLCDQAHKWFEGNGGQSLDELFEVRNMRLIMSGLPVLGEYLQCREKGMATFQLDCLDHENTLEMLDFYTKDLTGSVVPFSVLDALYHFTEGHPYILHIVGAYLAGFFSERKCFFWDEKSVEEALSCFHSNLDFGALLPKTKFHDTPEAHIYKILRKVITGELSRKESSKHEEILDAITVYSNLVKKSKDGYKITNPSFQKWIMFLSSPIIVNP